MPATRPEPAGMTPREAAQDALRRAWVAEVERQRLGWLPEREGR